MATQTDNPLAFPVTTQWQADPQLGMDLRDYFAGQIAPALIIADTNDDLNALGSVEAIQRHVASISYAYADAMLAERGKRTPAEPSAIADEYLSAEVGHG